MSPDVQFTGIDEPDDVVNLTYQELFTRGGFILLNKSVLEPLSLCMFTLNYVLCVNFLYFFILDVCVLLIFSTVYEFLGNMKKISQILQELSGMGKWKWILHYKDSRRLKENAR